MRKLLMTVFGLLLMAVTVRSASAQCTQLMNPGDDSYTTLTHRCSLGTPPTTTSTCGPGASFSSSLTVRMVFEGWATWSSPPFSEMAVPVVGYTLGETLTINLAAAAAMTGFEIEPNFFAGFNITASFKAGTTEVASVTRAVAGAGGARLFAESCPCQLIDRIDISAPGSGGFAIAQLRSDQFPAGAEEDRVDTDPPAIPDGLTSNTDLP